MRIGFGFGFGIFFHPDRSIGMMLLARGGNIHKLPQAALQSADIAYFLGEAPPAVEKERRRAQFNENI